MDILSDGTVLGHSKDFGLYLSEMVCHEGFCTGKRNDLTYIFKL